MTPWFDSGPPLASDRLILSTSELLWDLHLGRFDFPDLLDPWTLYDSILDLWTSAAILACLWVTHV